MCSCSGGLERLRLLLEELERYADVIDDLPEEERLFARLLLIKKDKLLEVIE